MKDYNDGKWHGWNGGECPVHPCSTIHGIEESGTKWTAPAGNNDWLSFRGAFRVVKEFREPREFWISCGRLFMSEAHALEYSGAKPIHVREVTEQ